jgi:hypothetical protein
MHQQERFSLPGDGIREITTPPSVVTGLATEPVREIPATLLQPPVQYRQPAERPDDRQRLPPLRQLCPPLRETFSFD